jgi:hypothetical protein
LVTPVETAVSARSTSLAFCLSVVAAPPEAAASALVTPAAAAASERSTSLAFC